MRTNIADGEKKRKIIIAYTIIRSTSFRPLCTDWYTCTSMLVTTHWCVFIVCRSGKKRDIFSAPCISSKNERVCVYIVAQECGRKNHFSLSFPTKLKICRTQRIYDLRLTLLSLNNHFFLPANVCMRLLRTLCLLSTRQLKKKIRREEKTHIERVKGKSSSLSNFHVEKYNVNNDNDVVLLVAPNGIHRKEWRRQWKQKKKWRSSSKPRKKKFSSNSTGKNCIFVQIVESIFIHEIRFKKENCLTNTEKKRDTKWKIKKKPEQERSQCDLIYIYILSTKTTFSS